MGGVADGKVLAFGGVEVQLPIFGPRVERELLKSKSNNVFNLESSKNNYKRERISIESSCISI